MKKYDNFCKALINLEDIYRYEEPYDNVVLTGLVALFEICFEQSWKCMKEVLAAEGIEAAASSSPKLIIKEAYQTGLIIDADNWILALAARNNVAHSYNELIAKDIVQQTKEKFVPLFRKLREDVEERLKDMI